MLGLVANGQNVRSWWRWRSRVAASANLPTILYSLFWRRFNTTGALFSIYGGLATCLVLIVFSPALSGKPTSMIKGVDFDWFPLDNPGRPHREPGPAGGALPPRPAAAEACRCGGPAATSSQRAAAALVRAREAGMPVPATDPPHGQRLRAALSRDVATLLALPAGHVVVGEDPIRAYGGVSGQLIIVEDPDDPDIVLRLVPKIFCGKSSCPAQPGAPNRQH